MFVDLVFLGDFCNLDCVYCSAGATRWRQLGERLVAIRPGGARVQVDLLRLRRTLFDVIDRLQEQGVVGLKLSGGEIFVKPALAAAIIEHACRSVEVVQVLTNATRVAELGRLLEAHSNLYLQVSLDGATPLTNLARSRVAGRTRQVLDNIRMLARRVPLEVNVVLTRWNTAALPELLSFLEHLRGDIVAYPFPVRLTSSPGAPGTYGESVDACGPFLPAPRAHGGLVASGAELRGLDRVLENHERWAAVLPPLSYMQALREFFAAGNRRRDCGIPRAITGVDQDGVQSVCPCGDLGVGGNVKERLRSLGPARVWGPPCPGCFTHYEIVHHTDDPAAVRQGFTRRLVECHLEARREAVVCAPAGSSGRGCGPGPPPAASLASPWRLT